MKWKFESDTQLTSTPIFAGSQAGLDAFKACHLADKHQWTDTQDSDQVMGTAATMIRQKCSCGGVRFIIRGDKDELTRLFTDTEMS